MTLKFPMRATIEGVDVVIVPASEYDRLSGGDASISPIGEQPSKTSLMVDQLFEQLHAREGPRRKILYDVEVARFLIEKLDAMSPDAVRQACVELFGTERTPSGYAIKRLSADIREERRQAMRLQSLGSGFSSLTVKPR